MRGSSANEIKGTSHVIESRTGGSMHSTSLWRGAASVLIAFAVSRLVIFGLIYLSRMIVVPGKYAHPGGLLSVLTDWDGSWYLSIVQNGYSFTPGKESNLGFFPFYPMLVWAVSFGVPSVGLAGVLVSNGCLIAAGLLLNALINLDYDDLQLNHRAAMFLMFSPVSFFFSDAYTESTFLMLALAAFLAARRGQWLVACLCGMCLSATRNAGLLITLPLLMEFVRSHWNPAIGLRSLLRPQILLFALVPMGFGFFMLYCQVAFGDPFAFFRATSVWGRTLSAPWIALSRIGNFEPFYRWLFAGAVITGVALFATAIWLKIRPSYVVFAGLLIMLYLCANSLEGIPRYLSVVFPFYITLALLSRRYEWSYTVLFATTAVVLALCTILSANGYWLT